MIRVVFALLIALTCLWGKAAEGCPFCGPVEPTLAEELGESYAAVLARLIERRKTASESDAPECRFEVVQVLKNDRSVAKGRHLAVPYIGEEPVGTVFLLFGNEPPELIWTTPTPLTDRSREFMSQLQRLPSTGADRLAFFQGYFESPEPLLANDAFDEFAKAPYADVKALKDRMDRGRLVRWIGDSNVPSHRRRLYLTMLGTCGGEQEIPVLVELMQTADRTFKPALDAVVACYLTLTGLAGMPTVEDLYLKNVEAEYTDVYAAVMALRFHGQEEKIIPRDRLAEAFRLLLDRPKLANLVIPDLARWEDWSVVERLARLFEEVDDESRSIRVPIIQFLRVCPLPAAKAELKKLSELDPDSVQDASLYQPSAASSPLTNPPIGPPNSAEFKQAIQVLQDSKATQLDEPRSEEPTDAWKPLRRLVWPGVGVFLAGCALAVWRPWRSRG